MLEWKSLRRRAKSLIDRSGQYIWLRDMIQLRIGSSFEQSMGSSWVEKRWTNLGWEFSTLRLRIQPLQFKVKGKGWEFSTFSLVHCSNTRAKGSAHLHQCKLIQYCCFIRYGFLRVSESFKATVYKRYVQFGQLAGWNKMQRSGQQEKHIS